MISPHTARDGATMKSIKPANNQIKDYIYAHLTQEGGDPCSRYEMCIFEWFHSWKHDSTSTSPICDWGTMVFCLSHKGEKSRPCSCSLSPCLKNSSMHLGANLNTKAVGVTWLSTGNVAPTVWLRVQCLQSGGADTAPASCQSCEIQNIGWAHNLSSIFLLLPFLCINVKTCSIV